MKRLLLALLVVGVSTFAYAQNPVLTNPTGRTAVASGSTIATTNTFQTLFASNDRRSGCIVQNNGTHNMYLNIVSRTTATLSNSAVIIPGGTGGCALYGTVITGEISLTGTSGDSYYASQY